MSVFDTLSQINVNDKTEKKKTGSSELTYLSWTYAIGEIKKRYPDFTYTVYKDPRTGLPYVFDPETGYMVFTSVTIDGVTNEMWLPVMDGANHAMRAVPYTIKTKYKEIPVEKASMFDINKTIMRCLTKNLAMFGLGLYIYSGEDLPEGEEPEQKTAPKQEQKKAPVKEQEHITDNHVNVILNLIEQAHFAPDTVERFKKFYQITDWNQLTPKQYEKLKEGLQERIRTKAWEKNPNG